MSRARFAAPVKGVVAGRCVLGWLALGSTPSPRARAGREAHIRTQTFMEGRGGGGACSEAVAVRNVARVYWRRWMRWRLRWWRSGGC
eukprot:scaffold125621_cov81-Phaeocystis_antarctica.AAC.1